MKKKKQTFLSCVYHLSNFEYLCDFRCKWTSNGFCVEVRRSKSLNQLSKKGDLLKTDDFDSQKKFEQSLVLHSDGKSFFFFNIII